MSRIVMETNRGDRVEILPYAAGKWIFEKFADSAPSEVELLHVKWSGDAVFFFHTLPVAPPTAEFINILERGSVAYVPDLGEFILAYGDAAPRDRRGTIEVSRIGTVSNPDALVRLGKHIWRHGLESARVRVEP